MATPVIPAAAANLRINSQPHHNLPLQLTSLVGRVQEIAEVRREMARTQLLTLAGPGGIGKTRLALAVAEQELPIFPDGVWFVDLSSLVDPALVVQRVATVLEVRESPPEELIRTLITELQPRTLLLILDNCEQVLGVCVDVSSVSTNSAGHCLAYSIRRRVGECRLTVAHMDRRSGHVAARVTSLGICDRHRTCCSTSQARGLAVYGIDGSEARLRSSAGNRGANRTW